MNEFDPGEYWETRLEKNFNLHGVGYQSLGVRYNQWMYRVRRKIVEKKIRSYISDFSRQNVLDVGSGTGFYIQLWRDLGLRNIVGCDITRVAVDKLQKAFPDLKFIQMDIGETIAPLKNQRFDFISAFDVLFHIVDDARFTRAIENIHSLLNPGGFFMWSDNFIHQSSITIPHQVSRPLQYSESILRQLDFEIIDRAPMFYLMNAPVDTQSILVKRLWQYYAQILSLSEFLGGLAGAFLYPFELLLTSLCKESPSTEIMICKKRE